MITYLRSRAAVRNAIVSCLLALPLAASAQMFDNNSHFTQTAIAGNNTIWFNAGFSGLKFSDGARTAPEVVLHMRNANVTFTAGGVEYVVAVPDSRIVLSDSVTKPTSSFVNGRWHMVYPKSETQQVFLGGVMWTVPPQGLPGGISPIVWAADFVTTSGTVSKFKWRFSAAVYDKSAGQPNVQLEDNNNRMTGTPINYTSSLLPGAMGHGGTNYTGSFSSTEVDRNLPVSPEADIVPPPTGSLNLSRNTVINGSTIPVGYQITRY